MSKAISGTYKSYLPGLLLFLIWPFGSLIYAIRNLSKNPVLIFILIGFFYGITYNFISESDMTTYIKEFQNINSWNYNSLVNAINSGQYSDYYTITLSFIISRFTENGKIYIGIALLIYSIFYFKSVFLILKNINISGSKTLYLLIFASFFYITLFYANSLRFYTAMYVFIYSILQLLINKNLKASFLILLTPFIHFSFYLPTALYALFIITGRKRILAIMLFISSFFIGQFVNYSEYTKNEAGQKKISAYTTESGIYDMEGKFLSNRTSISVRFIFYQGIIKYHYYFGLVFLSIVLIKKPLRLSFDNINPQLININLVILSTANLTINWFQGERFQNLFMAFLVLTSTYAYAKTSEKGQFKVFWILLLGTIPFAVSTIYVYFNTVSLEFFVSNIIFQFLTIKQL